MLITKLKFGKSFVDNYNLIQFTWLIVLSVIVIFHRVDIKNLRQTFDHKLSEQISKRVKGLMLISTPSKDANAVSHKFEFDE